MAGGKKRRYERPTIVRLDAAAKSTGECYEGASHIFEFCYNGTSDAHDACTNGLTYVGHGCEFGNWAGVP